MVMVAVAAGGKGRRAAVVGGHPSRHLLCRYRCRRYRCRRGIATCATTSTTVGGGN